MNEKALRIIGAVETVVLLAMVIWAAVSGGCSTQLETTAGGTCFMKCHWTFYAVPFAGAIGVVAAALSAAAKSVEARRFLAVISLVTAIVAIVLTTSFGIGLCSNADMHCHTTAMGVWVLAAIAIILALVQIVKADPAVAEKPKMQL